MLGRAAKRLRTDASESPNSRTRLPSSTALVMPRCVESWLPMLAFGMLAVAPPTVFSRRAEHTVRVPPPLAEPLHWLIVTTRPEDWLPVAVQVRDVPPPLAEPLHCVMAAPVVFAGYGLQAFTVPVVTDPTHWLTVAAVTDGVKPTKLLVTNTLHRSVPPPPLIEPLHCVTAVTGWLTGLVVLVHEVVGTPAEPVQIGVRTTDVR